MFFDNEFHSRWSEESRGLFGAVVVAADLPVWKVPADVGSVGVEQAGIPGEVAAGEVVDHLSSVLLLEVLGVDRWWLLRVVEDAERDQHVSDDLNINH